MENADRVAGLAVYTASTLFVILIIMKNKTIVITGASKGLGASLAELLVVRGAKAVISARDAESLNEVATKTGAVACVADVTKPEDMIKLAEFAEKTYGPIDIWINNAGIWLPKTSFEDIDMARAHNLIEVNLFGTMYGCRAVIGGMKKRGQGMIVNIVSTSALSGRPGQTAYSSSKYAARGFTDSLREELKEEGSPIKVIGVYPGGIKTHLFDERPPAEIADFMTPESVAEKIITNLELDQPEMEQVIRRPGQK